MSSLNIQDFPNVYAFAKASFLQIRENLIKRKIVNIEDFTSQLDEINLQIFYQNLIGICLTDGCYGNCYFCSELAKSKIDKQFSYSSIVNFMEKYYACNIPDYQKEEIIPYFDTDLLDYAEVDKKGNVKRDFQDILNLFQNHIPAHIAYMTRLPAWCIPSFIEYATTYIKNTAQTKLNDKKLFDNFFHLCISINRDNKIIIEKVIEELAQSFSQFIPFNIEEIKHLILKNFTNEIDALILEDCLSNYGRNYQENIPYETLNISCRCFEGFRLTPNGIYSTMNIIPDQKNPSGLLTLPFYNDAPYFQRNELNTLHGNMRKPGKVPLLQLSLNKNLVGKSELLNPDNIIKREAFRFKNLDNSIYYYGIASLMLAYYEAPDGQEHFLENIITTRKLLNDTPTSNLIIADLKKKIEELLIVMENFIPYLEKKDLTGLTNEYFYYLCKKYNEDKACDQILSGKIDFSKPPRQDNDIWAAINHRNIYGAHIRNQKNKEKILRRIS